MGSAGQGSELGLVAWPCRAHALTADRGPSPARMAQGIATLILESPFYGERKPPNQQVVGPLD